MRQLLSGSAADSAFVQHYLDTLLDGDYIDTFGLQECVVELDIVAELANEFGVPFSVSSATTRLHHEALDEFGPDGGEMGAARLLERRVGTTLGRPLE
jgi:3-hydroxyisobutyrate dehydrogenase-like beta-hydroxyacid dehydrogenase